MLEILFCIYMLLFYMIVYFSFGSLVTVRMKEEKFSVTFTMMIGFFLYYGIFQVIAVPCTFLKLPLSWLAQPGGCGGVYVRDGCVQENLDGGL